ncbi:MAG: DUF3810 domain-containing protein [Oscillospiraceae bacterium]|jgi:hypothetical protein|nr:DUF3810 domain-containing protein [Oscillospiraceae bacterium]
MRRLFQKAGICKRLWFFMLLPAALALNTYAAWNPFFAQWYAGRIYFALSLTVNRLTGLVPFSVAELLTILFLPATAAALIYFAAGMIRKRRTRKLFVLKSAVNLCIFFSIVFFLFTINCGINYYRYPFANTCGLTVKPSSQAELSQLCTALSSDLNRLRSGLKTNKRGIMRLSRNNLSLTAQEAAQTYDLMEQDYPLLHSGYSAPKLVYFSRAMSRCNITGIFFPFTLEANVNTDVPEYTIPVTMCHELSHLRGYMREDEANFIGYLVCCKSDNPDFQYSGDMLAFTYASNALFAANPEAANRIFSSLDDGVLRDLAYQSEYWKQFEGPVAEVSNSVNDHYLKANNQSDGVKSYGRMVDLLLAQQRMEKQSN